MLVAFNVGLLLVGCTPDESAEMVDSGAPTICSSAPESTFAIGSTVLIEDIAPPCRLVFQETGTVLRADPNGARPDPGNQVVQDGRGRFYTTGASGFPSQVSLWESDGSYITTLGRPGDGPGEFTPRFGLALLTDHLDQLHVLENSRWHVFGSDQAFVHTVQAGMGGGMPDLVALLDDGSIVSSVRIFGMGNQESHYFRLFDSSGSLVRSIAPIDSSNPPPSGARPVAYAGGETFWTGPIGSSGYTLEEWSVDGELQRTIQREVPWFPRSAPEQRGMTEAEWMAASADAPPPQMSGMHIDEDGLLLTILVSPTDAWRPLTPLEMTESSSEELQAIMGPMYVGRIEIFDSRSGGLLASESFPADAFPLDGRIPRTNLGYKSETGTDLLPSVKIIEYRLVPR
jgi:hypothetical protein